MSPQVLARAFDPFFTTKPLGQGTGLGLSMVHGFVQQSGGFVRILSEQGKGTDVRVYLPSSQERPPETTSPRRVEVPHGAGAVVLVVEDEVPIREMLAELLEASGYLVLKAESGTEALDILGSARRIDLLVTDVGLPGGMNGRQLADTARVARKSLAVIFITGYAEVDVLRDARLPARTAVIAKPFETHALLARAAQLTQPIER